MKEVYRHPHWEEDVIQLAHEPQPEGYHRILRPVMRNGEMIPGSLPPLSEIRELAQYNLQQLPCWKKFPCLPTGRWLPGMVAWEEVQRL